MKTVVSISFGPSGLDSDFEGDFLGERFRVVRRDVASDEEAVACLNEWRDRADAIGLGLVHDHATVGIRHYRQPGLEALEAEAGEVPLTTGRGLRDIVQEWSVRATQERLGAIFTNAKVLMLSGMDDYRLATVLRQHTGNLRFADPLLCWGVPVVLGSLRQLEWFASLLHRFSTRRAATRHVMSGSPLQALNRWRLRRAVRAAHVVVATYPELASLGREDLEGKVVLTTAVSPQRLVELKERGVRVVVDCSLQLFDHPLGLNAIEALLLARRGRGSPELIHDDYLDLLKQLDAQPRILFPQEKLKQINRFAFVIHPLSQQYFKHAKPLNLIADRAPPWLMNVIEKVFAYAPPFVYSKVTGIRSPTGVEAEGWLITVGGTPKEIMSHSPEFTYRRLLKAADMARRLGAQIMGLGAFTKVVGDAGVTVAKRAPLPITTGNSYSASGALWAAHDAVARLGLVPLEHGKKVEGKAMVVGATGAIGSACARLLARTVTELHLVSPESAKLLILEESIQADNPDVKLVLSSYADSDENLGDMDMIVTATSGAGKKILDIMQVKPGCVITDVARPLDLPPEDVAKRPDVLVIESGEVELPGDVRMKNIGFDNRSVVYACLAETIVLALAGRFENFTIGRSIEWEKVHEIYKLGLEHGMKLATISGVNGPFSEDDIAAVRERALAALADAGRGEREIPTLDAVAEVDVAARRER
jgi:predicted amino acid dehydrogenase